jgi:hypothetical protein
MYRNIAMNLQATLKRHHKEIGYTFQQAGDKKTGTKKKEDNRKSNNRSRRNGKNEEEETYL